MCRASPFRNECRALAYVLPAHRSHTPLALRQLAVGKAPVFWPDFLPNCISVPKQVLCGFSGAPRGSVKPAPVLGQHTNEVLAELLGLRQDWRLHDAGIVGGPME